jgi:hypothetical protein
MNHVIKLPTWWLPQTSGYSCLWVAAIWIDLHLAGENLTNTPHAFHVWSKTICISRGPHISTFHTVTNRVEQGHWSREKGLLTQSIARRLIDSRVHTQFSPELTNEVVGAKPSICCQPATRLTGPINMSMRLVRSILAHGGQPISP